MDDVRHKLPSTSTPRFLDQVRFHIRTSGLAYRTEQIYIHWVKRFIYFHGKQHPKDMGMAEVEAFLNHIAVDRNCSVSTQRIALNALIYLYKRFMGIDVGQLEFSPAQAHRRLQVVYSRQEVATTEIYTHVVNRGGKGC